MQKKPDEINMNAENAFLLREAAKAHADGYSDHLTYGGKGDPAEERWIEALSAGADALALIQQLEAKNVELSGKIGQLEAERDAAVKSLRGRCFECKHNKTSVCLICSKDNALKYWEWRGVTKEE